MIIACLLLPTAFAAAEDGWMYLYTRDGIDVFQKDIPGTGSHAFRGFGFVDARLEVIGAVIRDIPAYPRWVARCRKAVVLQDIDFNTKIFYSIVDAPPPFQDRDMVIQNDTVYDLEKGTAEITFRLSDQTLVPSTDNYYRVTELSGEYLLEYFGRDKTRITFEYRGCPGGNVPVRLADWIESRHYPYINIMGIRRMVREQKYIEAGAESPDRELIENAGSDPGQVAKIFKNRIGEYIVDRRVLDIVFDDRAMQDMVRKVHADKTTFESIQQAVTGVFSVLAFSPAVAACIEDKPLEDIICLETLMREKWLVDLIARNRPPIEGYLNTSGTNIERLFYKITTSEKAVGMFIRDEDLARAILTSESVRTRLWQDSGFKKEVLDKILTFENAGDFEKIVAEWVGGNT
ncbi:MAG: START domain-containing protein [Thermodesulfobacteriota bacterium]